jgi:hypothetical protein
VEELSDRSDLRYGRRLLESTEAIQAALEDVVGKASDRRCRPGPSTGASFTLACRTNAAAQRVQLLVPEILRRVAELSGRDDVQALRVTVDPEGWD